MAEFPEMPATVIAERVGWDGSMSWFRENVARLRPEHRQQRQRHASPGKDHEPRRDAVMHGNVGRKLKN
jgi:hypothetical protein